MHTLFDAAQLALFRNQLRFERLADPGILIASDVSSRTQVEVIVDALEQGAWYSKEVPTVIHGPIPCEPEREHGHHPRMICQNPEQARIVLAHKTHDLVDPLVMCRVLQMEHQGFHASTLFIEPRM